MWGSSAASSRASRLYAHERNGDPPSAAHGGTIKRRHEMRGLLTAAVGMAVLGAVVTATTSYAAQATLSCPRVVRAGQQFTAELTVDVSTTPLGAYSLTITFDPRVVTIASVAGGSTAEFSRPPTTRAQTTTTARGPLTSRTSTGRAFGSSRRHPRSRCPWAN